jgi:type VI secretion system protein ImpK
MRAAMPHLDNPLAGGLVAEFRAFYAELLRLRGEIDAATMPPTPLQDMRPSLMPDAEIVARQLQAVLARQLARGVDPQACYAMAALADDIFLHEVHWPGRDRWREMLLEWRMFQSHVAGEEVFARIALLLQERRPSQLALAHVYLLVLQQGFRGGLRGAADSSRLEDYAAGLYAFAYHHPPNPYRENRALMPQALSHTIAGTPLAPRRFGGRGAWLAAGCVGVILLAAQIAWMVAISSLPVSGGAPP